MATEAKQREPARPERAKRVCFVTTGATAAFDGLVEAVLEQSFLDALSAASYTDLIIQYGESGDIPLAQFHGRRIQGEIDAAKIAVNGFAFNRNGLGHEMRAAKGEAGGRDAVEGVVVSHAGTGCILDALRIGVPLIVVPNPSLLDNHQLELAEELAKQGYAVLGDINDLPAAIRRIDELAQSRQNWPPLDSKADPSGRGFAGVMDYEMGFFD